MKKTIIWSILAILSGILLGKLTFDKYENLDIQSVSNMFNYVYMVRYGSYETKDEMVNSIIDIDRYVFIEADNKYKAYIGISKTKKNAQKIVDIYDKNNLKIEKVNIENEEFIYNLDEYEKLLEVAEDKKSIMIIENQILSCYEKLVTNDE